jgi:hypothetical protein
MSLHDDTIRDEVKIPPAAAGQAGKPQFQPSQVCNAKQS